ncbi:hypothetical protein J2Y69_002304 [Microbacterium resistens]|uniref:Helicase-associated domain-containing protein n=1 Tax=Microbacterium resistens TaxID=156977 RepID=A0ABU1SDK9_9MICO|nr:hypothetical protein [Microbacterium resistens]
MDRHLPGWNRPTQRDLWKTRALEVSVFVQTHDRLPTEKGKEDGEERLGAWVSRQRTAARTDPEKFAPRRRVLDQIAPGWLPETSHGPAASRTRIDRTVEEAAHADGAQSVAAWINGWHRQGLSRRATAAIMGVSPGTLARLIREHGISWTQTPAPAERTPFAEIVHRLDRNLPLPRPDAASARDRRLAEWIASRPDARTRLATISRTLDTGRP